MNKFLKSLVSLTMAFGMLAATACGDGEKKNEGGKPVITIVNHTMTDLTPSDIEDMDWYSDVTVTDDKDKDLTATISDWGGLDATDPQPGTYTITYKVTDSDGNEATETRTVTVVKAAAQIVVEAQKHRNTNGPDTVILPFELENYIELTAESATEYEKGNYVFHNDAETTMTISVVGDYAVAAIINANGLAIEGNDAANGRKMNAANPIRSTSSVSVATSDAGKNLAIPADGYAIIVQIGYLTDGKDTAADNDGRNFLAHNVIWRYKTPVRIYNTEAPTTYFTTYVDQAPIVETSILSVGQGVSVDEAKARAITGLKIEDDNGTFEITDDVTENFTVSVTDVGGYNADTLGTYTFTMKVADDKGNETVFTRDVKVESKLMTLTISGSGNSMSVNEVTQFFILGANDSAPSVLKDAFYLITPEFKAKNATFLTNGWGQAIVLNQYGEIIRVYDGQNGKYFDATNTSGVVDSTKCTAAGYLAEAYASLQAGEYLLVAPNAAPNTCRAFAFSNLRVVGQTITFTGTDKEVVFQTKPKN